MSRYEVKIYPMPPAVYSIAGSSLEPTRTWIVDYWDALFSECFPMGYLHLTASGSYVAKFDCGDEFLCKSKDFDEAKAEVERYAISRFVVWEMSDES